MIREEGNFIKISGYKIIGESECNFYHEKPKEPINKVASYTYSAYNFILKSELAEFCIRNHEDGDVASYISDFSDNKYLYSICMRGKDFSYEILFKNEKKRDQNFVLIIAMSTSLLPNNKESK